MSVTTESKRGGGEVWSEVAEAATDPLALQSAILARLDAMSAQLERLERRAPAPRGAGAELAEEMMPIAKLAMAEASERLAALEARGYFDYGRELLHAADNVVAAYPPEAVRELADNVVRIVGVVRRLTQPAALELFESAARAAEAGDPSDPMGIMGVLKATRSDEDVRRGLAILVELLRQLGRSTRGAGQEPASGHTGLNPLLGAKRNLARKSSAGASSRPTAAPPPPAPEASSDEEPDEAWTPEVAERRARAEGIALTDAHWEVIRFIRADYEAQGATPNIRRITTESGVDTKALFRLFPKAPARTAARISGVPKPAGCV